MWDSWIYVQNENTYHLFYLETVDRIYDHIGHAVSTDLINWEELRSISVSGAPGSWNSRITLTGMVTPFQGKYYMLLGGYAPENPDKAIEIIGRYVSDDLENWQEDKSFPLLKPSFPYMTECDISCDCRHWRDLSLSYDQNNQWFDGYLMTKVKPVSPDDFGTAVGHIRSRDLVHWEMLEPIARQKHFYNMEVPEVFEFNGRYYLTFSTNSLTGLKINSSRGTALRGTFYLTSSSRNGPFTLPPDPFLIGSGHGHWESYVGRTLEQDDQRILYHHMGNPFEVRPAWGTPKKLASDSEGNLHLEYLPVLQKMENGKSFPLKTHIETGDRQDLIGYWKRNNKDYFGKNYLAGTSCRIADDVDNCHFKVDLFPEGNGMFGIIFRQSEYQAGAFILDLEHQSIFVGNADIPPDYNYAHGMFGWDFCIHDQTQLPEMIKGKYELRIFLRNEFCEVYVNDIWCFSATLPKLASCGALSLYVERGEAHFENLHLAQLNPLL